MIVPAIRTRSSWAPGARAAGFTPESEGERLHRIGMTLVVAGGWAALSHPILREGEDADGSQMGLPGLWRRFSEARAEFDLPPQEALTGNVEFEPLLDWALATADGRTPNGWRAPPESEILAGVRARDLVARAGTHVVRGEIRRTRDRLSVVFPRVLRIPEGLDDSRRAWIGVLTDDAQRKWRLVRIGPDAEGTTLRAEVDLTGAPPEAAAALVALAAPALRLVVEWALPALRLAADPSVRSHILERHPCAGDARRKD